MSPTGSCDQELTTAVLIRFMVGTVFEKTATGPLNGSLRLLELKNIHFPNGPFTKNIISEEFGFDLTPESVEMKWAFRLKGTRVRWDPDWQDFFDNAKAIVQPLLDLRPRKTGVKKPVVKSDGRSRMARKNLEYSDLHLGFEKTANT